jgi:hypothetical protein
MSSMPAVAASGFTFVSWWQSCCVRGRACWRWKRHSVPKRRLLILRRRGNTQKTTFHSTEKLFYQVGDLFELNVKLRCQNVNKI